ncbi:MAG TPA: hypothetical protein VL854_06855 [Nitrososphaeraceae archaeon]|nr:hypothetical protein [Nitrososphaeraceae archaeon]
MTEQRILFTRDNFKAEIAAIFRKHGLDITPNPQVDIKGWVWRVRTLNPLFHFVYAKYESTTRFYTANRDAKRPDIWKNGAKTINLKLFAHLAHMKPLVIFADPYFIRAISYYDVATTGVVFTQQSNYEEVIGVDVNDLIGLDKYLEMNNKP